MCGRFSLKQTPEELAQAFQLSTLPELAPRYNIAPTQTIAALLSDASGSEASLQFRLLRWGLIPSWAKDKQMGARLINARSETVAEKPAFRSAFKYRRCLILADGFYEWQRTDQGKQPFYFHLQDQQPFAFAGLWEHWNGNETTPPIDSCTILTTTANELLEPIHDRMPVMLAPESYDLWLNPQAKAADLLTLLHPYEATVMASYPVSSQVNSPIHDTPDCVEPLSLSR